MTPEEQRIAIAEACGRKFYFDTKLNQHIIDEYVPDYLNNLNAMHGAVASQPQEFQHAFEVMMNHHSSVTGKLFCRMEASDWADIFLQVKRKLAETKCDEDDQRKVHGKS